MADVIRFPRSAPIRPANQPDWQRFPRYEEVGAHIDEQVGKLVDVAASIAAYKELYARVEQRLRPEDRPLLRDLFEAITRHHERYEHAAYLVGLRAGAGRLTGLPPLTDERVSDNEPEGA
ncbi:MAG TPA: hypothetical protein VIL25_03505 [Vicinamibacterales bacterium]